MIRRFGAAAALLAALLALPACAKKDNPNAGRPKTSWAFPKADRPVSGPEGDEFSTEDQRDRRGEDKVVMDLARIEPGMTVADIGAGAGYYTVRLAARVGAKGRVLAQDIDHAILEQLGNRVEHDRLDNVSIKLGATDDPRLPDGSFDRIFMVHVYHEIAEPYAFLWRMRPALRPGGKVVVVDVDRPTDHHGIPPPLLFCEFNAVGFRLVQFVRRPELTGYYAEFEAAGARPAPASIKPCTGAAPAQPSVAKEV